MRCLLILLMLILGSSDHLFSQNNEKQKIGAFATPNAKISKKRKAKWKRSALFNQSVVTAKKIEIPNFPKSFNPSIIKTDQGILLSFRYMPDPQRLWISRIGLVMLNDDLEPIGEAQLINTRRGNHLISSQSEDARLFSFQGKLYLIYNDNIDVECPNNLQRRDMFIAELRYVNNKFKISEPLKLRHSKKYAKQLWQKNWVPFEWNGQLFLAYSIVPHEILAVDFETGICEPVFSTEHSLPWKWGVLRGGTGAELIDGEYVSFFHSSTVINSNVSKGKPIWHYFFGAYTFSSQPPFELKKMTITPFAFEDFYTVSECPKRVVFPGGFIVKNSKFYVAYGKDDCEVWIATISKSKLKELLRPIP